MPFPAYGPQGDIAAQVIAPNLPQYARTTQVVFETEFFEDAPANTTPAVPANAAMYPAYAIVDPNGMTVNKGVGVPGSAPGRWQTRWNIGNSEPLSTLSNKWRIIWNMVTAAGHQLQRTDVFDVIDLRTPDTLEDLRETGYLAYAGQGQRVALRLPRRPQELTVTAYPQVGLASPVPSDTASFTGSLADGTVNEYQEQNLYTYTFNTPKFVQPTYPYGDYQIVWNVQQTLTSPNETIVQQLSVPPPVFWPLAKSLRTLIDKLQKKAGTVHDYADSDIYEYFKMGVGIVNGVTPQTNWDLASFPYSPMMTRFLVEGAALWALQAQHLLAVELQFSFSGQTVTLDMDHTGGYSEVVQRLLDDLNGEGKASLAAVKTGLTRNSQAIAHVANRQMGRRELYQPVYKTWSSTIGSSSNGLYNNGGNGGGLFNGPVPGQPVNVGWSLVDLQFYLGLV